jgi:hypothetical protein
MTHAPWRFTISVRTAAGAVAGADCALISVVKKSNVSRKGKVVRVVQVPFRYRFITFVSAG